MFRLSFLRSNARWLFAGFLLMFASSFGQTFFISLSASALRESFDLTHGGFGAVYMIATLCSAASLPFLGTIVDKFTVARVVTIIFPMLAIAAFILSQASTLIMLVLAIYLLRLFGQGMMTHTAQTAMARWFVATRGQALAVSGWGIQTGEALMPVIFVTLAGIFGWQKVWMIGAVFLLIALLPVVSGLTQTPRAPRADDGPDRRSAKVNWTRGQVLRDPVFWIIICAVLAPGFIGTVIFFHQVYLVELRGWDLNVFAGAFVVMALCSALSALLFGRLIDRYSAVQVFPLMLVPLAAAALSLAVAEGQGMAYIFMALLGVSTGFTATLLGAFWPEVYGLKHLGAIRSVVVALTVFATAIGPGVTGALIDLGVYYPYQIGAMGLYCVAMTLVLFPLRARLRARLSYPDE